MRTADELVDSLSCWIVAIGETQQKRVVAILDSWRREILTEAAERAVVEVWSWRHCLSPAITEEDMQDIRRAVMGQSGGRSIN